MESTPTRALAARLLAGEPLPDGAPQLPRLTIVSGPGAGRTFTVTDGAVLGRGRSARLALKDPAASREHARIEWRADRLAVLDLSSRNGVEVNGRRVRDRAVLGEGDQVRIGSTLLQLTGVAVATEVLGLRAAGPGASVAGNATTTPAAASPPASPDASRASRARPRWAPAALLAVGAALLAAAAR